MPLPSERSTKKGAERPTAEARKTPGSLSGHPGVLDKQEGMQTGERRQRAQGQPELLQAPVPWLQPSNLATCSRDGTASEGDGAARAQLPALPVPRSFLQGALPQDASRLGARSANSQVALTTHSLSKYVFSQETSA